MKGLIPDRLEKILGLEPGSRREFVALGTLWIGGVAFIIFAIIFYSLHALVIWTALPLFVACMLSGFVWSWIFWWIFAWLLRK